MHCFNELVDLSYNQRVEDLQHLAKQFEEICYKNHTVTVYDYSTNKLYLNGHIGKVAFDSDKPLSGSDNYVCINFYELNKVLYIKLFDLESHTINKKVGFEENGIKDKVKVFFPCIKILKIKTLKELFDEFCFEHDD